MNGPGECMRVETVAPFVFHASTGARMAMLANKSKWSC